MNEEFIGNAIDSDEESLAHYGVGHLNGGHSGRYPWGSGDTPYQRYLDFYTRYCKVTKENPGLRGVALAEKLGCFDKDDNASVKLMERLWKEAKAQHKQEQISQAREMSKSGMGASEIGRQLGKTESTIRGWLDESKNQSRNTTMVTADILRDMADKKKYIDVSSGANHYLGITESKLNDALDILKDEGYHVEKIQIRQMGTDHNTTFNVLTRPDVKYSDLAANRFDIQPIYDEPRIFNSDKQLSKLGMKYQPESIDSKRVLIRYNEEGGVDKDGLIELRPGLKDISIGASRYAQIRMAVDDKYYLKGMAVYKDDIPDGYDVIFNTNKHVGTPMMGSGDNSVLKKMKTKLDGTINWDNPFGATIKTQLEYEGDDGKLHPSKANIVNNEGDWGDWKKRLSSQFLSKQPDALAERQLNLDASSRKQEFEEIKSLTNPAVKQKLLLEFADGCDRAAVELKGAPLPGQGAHVIIPMPELRDNEVYAPRYKDGTVVALVRHPHEGTFAIPMLTVRNRGSVGEKVIGDAPDAIGINKNVADRLSGADFDGDSVIVIPQSSRVRVRSTPTLKDLEGFDAKEAYRGYEGMKVIDNQTKQREMGKVSNLITDMTFQGASPDEIARATKHSQCIIDAEKHELDWKRSEKENRIQELKEIYQGGGGASTIISRAKSPRAVPARKDWTPQSAIDKDGNRRGGIDPDTGEKVYEETGELKKSGTLKPRLNSTGEYVDLRKQTGKGEHAGEYYYKVGDQKRYVKEGEFEPSKKVFLNDEKKTGRVYYAEKDPTTQKWKRVYVTENQLKGAGIKIEGKTEEVKAMAKAKDAYELTSGGSREHYGYHIEKIYADYANSMKALGNQARKEYLSVKPIPANPEAREKYKDEITSLNRKLKDAQMNAPRERQAQLDANKTMAMLKASNPEISKEQEKKYRGQAIISSRAKTGASKDYIELTDSEWNAIQSGAISHTKLKMILDNCNQDILKEKATPRKGTAISSSMEALARSMKSSGYSARDIADRLGISTSSVYSIIK